MAATTLHSACLALLEHVAGELTAAGVAPPQRRLVSHGTPVEEIVDGECAEQLAVYWTLLVSSSAPTAANAPGAPELRADPGTTLATFVVELVRCAPVLGDDRSLPSAEALTAAAGVSAADGWALHHILRRSGRKAPAMFGDLSNACDVRRSSGVAPFGPRGGVQGVAGELVVQIDLNLWSNL